VCVCVCVCVSVHVCVCVLICVYLSVCMRACVDTCVGVHIKLEGGSGEVVCHVTISAAVTIRCRHGHDAASALSSERRLNKKIN
jgi:hypothetical protein